MIFKMFRKSYSRIFTLLLHWHWFCSSANDNKRRRKSEPATTQLRVQSSVGTTLTSMRSPELPKSSSTQRNPLTSPSSPAATRTKGRPQTNSETFIHLIERISNRGRFTDSIHFAPYSTSRILNDFPFAWIKFNELFSVYNLAPV